LACPEASQAKDASRAFSRRRATAPEGRQSEIVLELDRPIPTHRNKRDVWTLPSQPYHGAHRSTFPPALPRLCIRAGTRVGDTVLDPFFGAGTTGLEALRLQRAVAGIEINHDTALEAAERLRADCPLLNRIRIVSTLGNVA
jgi:DNA modification methylase